MAGGGGRSGGGVGEPGKGALTLATAGQGRGAGSASRHLALPRQLRRAAPGVPGSAAAAGWRARWRSRAAGAGGAVADRSSGGDDAAYVVGSDGYLHALNVQNGWENMTPALFLPANTRAAGLIVATSADGGPVVYAATTRGCGSQPDGVYAMDVASAQKTVTSFRPKGATIAGTAGAALRP